MKKFSIFIKRFLVLSASILTSIVLFIFAASIILNNTIMSSNFHKELFISNDIYSHVQSALDISLQNIFSSFETQSDNPQKEISSIIQSSTSPQMIKMNLDSVREGIFEYFNGEKNFLPDIYIDTNPISENNKINSDSKNTDEKGLQLQNNIKKINLNAVLSSINRTDISDWFLFVRLIFFLVAYLPELTLYLLAFFFLIAFVVSKKNSEIVNWIFSTLIISSLLFIISATALLLYLYKILPDNTYIISLFIPLNSDVLISYINGCLSPISFLCFITGIMLFLTAFLLIVLNRFSHMFKIKMNTIKLKIFSKLPYKSKKIINLSIIAFLFVLVICGFSFKLHSIYILFDENNYSTVLANFTGTNAVTQVISAKDDSIYTLQIKLIDGKTGEHIPNIKINISGKSEIPDKYSNVHGITDENGTVKFALGKGTFYLIFSSASGSNNYILPSPFFYDLKSVGTTIVTINLDLDEKIIQTSGIGEIEVLNEDNLALEGMELGIIKNSDEGEILNKHFSVTNKDGIAVFKLPEGTYTVRFSALRFPENYIIPESFNITISRDITTRYSIRLVKNTPVTIPQAY